MTPKPVSDRRNLTAVDQAREWHIYVCPTSASPYSCGCDIELDEDCPEIEIEVVRKAERDKFRQGLFILAGLCPPHIMQRYRERIRGTGIADGQAATDDSQLDGKDTP